MAQLPLTPLVNVALAPYQVSSASDSTSLGWGIYSTGCLPSAHARRSAPRHNWLPKCDASIHTPIYLHINTYSSPVSVWLAELPSEDKASLRSAVVNMYASVTIGRPSSMRLVPMAVRIGLGLTVAAAVVALLVRWSRIKCSQRSSVKISRTCR